MPLPKKSGKFSFGITRFAKPTEIIVKGSNLAEKLALDVKAVNTKQCIAAPCQPAFKVPPKAKLPKAPPILPELAVPVQPAKTIVSAPLKPTAPDKTGAKSCKDCGINVMQMALLALLVLTLIKFKK